VHDQQRLVDTEMIQNEATYRLFFPGAENPTRAQFAEAAQANDVLPVPWVESAETRRPGQAGS
jgi:(+)-trans-carveol dehydrogenase